MKDVRKVRLFFEALIVAMSKEMTVSSIAELVNIHEDSLWRILTHYVEKAMSKVNLSDLDTIGVDEISVKKGHSYVTLFYDLKKARVIHIEKWHYWGTHSNIKEIITLAKMIKRNSHGILESIKGNISNGVVEGLNNKIKTAFKRSYGSKTEKYRNTMIFLMAGKLSLPTRC